MIRALIKLQSCGLCEQEWMVLLHCGCRGLRTLNEHKLVHRDVRATNLLWTNEARQAAVLVDLDTAGPSGQTPNANLAGHFAQQWHVPIGDSSMKALTEAGVYDHLSDVHMLGKLLLGLSSSHSSEFHEFCMRLVNKELSAEAALQDPFLSGSG